MADRLTREHRSWNMSRIRSKDSKPEKVVRSALHRAGYRFRLHVRNLPGRPDIVMPRHKTVVFVHGCFWHRHPGCRYAYTPKSRIAFWEEKFRKNVERHGTVTEQLGRLGWRVLTVWECETSDQGALVKKLSLTSCSLKEDLG